MLVKPDGPKRTALTKEQIRSKILLKLKIQKEEDRKRKSKTITNKLFEAAIFKKAKSVMFYIAFDGEVDTKEMIKEAHKLGKIVAVPLCTRDRTLVPCILKEDAELKKGAYGIAEPTTKKFMDAKNLDLVVVPGIAFDRRGNRLGRGKGYYDRFLAKISDKAHSIGLAFGFQILPSIPTIKTDTAVDRVIFA